MHFLKADSLFDGSKFLPDDSLLILDDKAKLVEIVKENTIEPGKIEKLSGIITPGFVNAHCHTELSHLKDKIPQKTGLPGFGKKIIVLRNSFRKEEIKEQTFEADKEMLANGIVAVGDICNTADSFEMKAGSKIFYHSFIELLGLNPGRANDSFKAGTDLLDQLRNFGIAGSLAPHAPYSTSNDLIRKISEFNAANNFTGSIHNQESPEEDKFFTQREGGFADLYEFLQMDISWFKPPQSSSLKYYAHALLEQRSILVHNTFTKTQDIEYVKDKNIYWCFCPNANKYIEDALPDLNLFSAQKEKICFGTDSLASNTQLNLLSEVNNITEYCDLNLEDILKSLTSVGADALNISANYGTLIPGKNTGLNLISDKNRTISFVKKLC